MTEGTKSDKKERLLQTLLILVGFLVASSSTIASNDNMIWHLYYYALFALIIATVVLWVEDSLGISILFYLMFAWSFSFMLIVFIAENIAWDSIKLQYGWLYIALTIAFLLVFIRMESNTVDLKWIDEWLSEIPDDAYKLVTTLLLVVALMGELYAFLYLFVAIQNI